jgi:ribonuclease R
VEGLVKTEDLPGAFELDPVQHALVDTGSGKAYRVGDEVQVDLVSANPARRRIELALAGHAVRAAAPGEERPERGPRRGRLADVVAAAARAKGRASARGEATRRGHGHDEGRRPAAGGSKGTGQGKREAQGKAAGRGGGGRRKGGRGR